MSGQPRLASRRSRLLRLGLLIAAAVTALFLFAWWLGDPDEQLTATPKEFAKVRLGIDKTDVYYLVGSTPAQAREGNLECWYYRAAERPGYSYRFCFTGSVDFSKGGGRLVSKALVPGTP